MSVIIVGAGPGLGSALAMRFGCGGEKVAVLSRSETSTAALLDKAKTAGLQMRAFTADSGTQSSLASSLSEAIGWTGMPTVLIYNAASFNAETAETLDVETLHRNLGVNLYGAVQCVRAILPAMLERENGTILLTGGGLALNPMETWTSLAVGKAALRAYSQSLHKTAAVRGVHVATVTICGLIEPGGLFDPHRIAEAYWELHKQPRGGFVPEIVYRPEGAEMNYNET